jgi:hypothetical protein
MLRKIEINSFIKTQIHVKLTMHMAFYGKGYQKVFMPGYPTSLFNNLVQAAATVK